LVFIISDFLFEQPIEESFRPIVQYGHEVFATHVIDDEEENPNIDGHVVLVDSETRETLSAHVTEGTLAAYRSEFNKHRENTETFFNRSGWGYVSLRTNDDFENSVLTSLKKEGIFR
jgi:hypothetical protein